MLAIWNATSVPNLPGRSVVLVWVKVLHLYRHETGTHCQKLIQSTICHANECFCRSDRWLLSPSFPAPGVCRPTGSACTFVYSPRFFNGGELTVQHRISVLPLRSVSRQKPSPRLLYSDSWLHCLLQLSCPASHTIDSLSLSLSISLSLSVSLSLSLSLPR